MVFLARTEPASRNPNPACIRIMSEPMMIKNKESMLNSKMSKVSLSKANSSACVKLPVSEMISASSSCTGSTRRARGRGPVSSILEAPAYWALVLKLLRSFYSSPLGKTEKRGCSRDAGKAQ